MHKTTKLELHYYLSGASHSMDARVRNNCESEILAIVEHVSEELQFPVSIEVEALREGGIKDVLSFFGNDKQNLILFSSLLTCVFAFQAIPDRELIELQKEELRLSITQLQQQLRKNENVEKPIKNIAELISHQPKIIARKSEFYKSAQKEIKVKRVGFTALDYNENPAFPEQNVERKNLGLTPKIDF